MEIPLACSADDNPFVSLPFNAVLMVAMGLANARNQALKRFVSYCSFVSYLFLTIQQENLHSDATGELHLPVTAYPESDESQYLVLGLARWVASILCSAFVLKAIFRVLPDNGISAFSVAASVATFLVLFSVRASGTDTKYLVSITEDQSVLYYLYFSQTIESVRGAMQVAFIADWNRVKDKVDDVIIYSFLIISQNLLSLYYGNYSLGPCNVFDVLLQFLLLACVHKCSFKKDERVVLVLTKHSPPPREHYVDNTKIGFVEDMLYPYQQCLNLETRAIEEQANELGKLVV